MNSVTQAPKFNRWILIGGCLLLMPIVRALFNTLPPGFGLVFSLGVVGLLLLRSLRQSGTDQRDDEQPSVTTYKPSTTKGHPMNSHFHHDLAGSNGQQPATGVSKIVSDLWNSKRHGLVMLCAALWVVCPFDFDFVPILGWVDDGFAVTLGFKHVFDLFRGDVTAVHAVMQTQWSPPAVRSAAPPPPPSQVIDAQHVVVRQTYEPRS